MMTFEHPEVGMDPVCEFGDAAFGALTGDHRMCRPSLERYNVL